MEIEIFLGLLLARCELEWKIEGNFSEFRTDGRSACIFIAYECLWARRVCALPKAATFLFSALGSWNHGRT